MAGGIPVLFEGCLVAQNNTYDSTMTGYHKTLIHEPVLFRISYLRCTVVICVVLYIVCV